MTIQNSAGLQDSIHQAIEKKRSTDTLRRLIEQDPDQLTLRIGAHKENPFHHIARHASNMRELAYMTEALLKANVGSERLAKALTSINTEGLTPSQLAISRFGYSSSAVRALEPVTRVRIHR